MKKKDSAGLGMTIPKKMRFARMTFYLRNGQVVGRASSTHEKRSNTLPQFIQRQKMRHTTALWKMLRFSMREVSWWDMTVVNGRLALVGEEFADEMKGWALVKVVDDRCSPQTIVTRCTLYEQYTTEEALERATDSYGGLTETPFLSPR